MTTIDLKSFAIANALAKRMGNFLAVLTVLLSFSVIPAFANDTGCSNAT
jgi:hypothetical protein